MASPPADLDPQPRRLRLSIRGAVQGVGFRPFVFRLACELELAGFVTNDPRGVVIEVEAEPGRLDRFRQRLHAELPPAAAILDLEVAALAATGEAGFAIRASETAGGKTAVVLPDRATCGECLAEIRDPAARRYRYPFTNCTHCGPRFTIVLALPYDRPNTTMAGFALCPDCEREYRDPADRRFHAQPIACPACGPQLALLDADGHRLAAGDQALAATATALADGAIVALLGIGGFQLLCDAGDEAAVARLRQRKHRPTKPLALLVADLPAAREIASVDDAEAALLSSPQAPIVLLQRRDDAGAVPVAAAVAPGNPTLGLMLPTTPLHHLLTAAFPRPLVATSGNRSDEPIAIEVGEGLARLAGIADRYLIHDRPLARHADDSVARVELGAPRLLRRARGHAPFPIRLAAPSGASATGKASDATAAPPSGTPTVLAVGPHLKATVGLLVGADAFLSQHLGDMETPESRRAFERVIADFLRLYEARPAAIAHDLHPDYPTTHWALTAAATGFGDGPVPRIAVQHHHAHLAACLADNGLPPDGEPVLGVTWDGTGYGPDETVWGGEWLLGDAAGYRRVARLRPFRLPGGEAAVREPRRVALALLHELDPGLAPDHPAVAGLGFGERDLALLRHLITRGTASPQTTSAGRLFDGLAALVGLGGSPLDPHRVSFEGEAAIALEHAAGRIGPGLDLAALALSTVRGHDGNDAGATLLELDWRPLVASMLAARSAATPVAELAAGVHRALADAIAAVAAHVGAARVALSGGCFQNRLLTAATVAGLEAAGHQVLLHRQVPANDGGIALGQLAVAVTRLRQA